MPAPMPWLLNVAYVALLAALSPMLIWRIVVRGKYRTGWREKLLGQVAQRGRSALPVVPRGQRR